MRKVIIFAAMMFLVSAVGFGQKMTVEQTLTKIEHDVVDGILKGDTSVFEKHFTEDAAVTDPGGMLMTRAEAITMFKSGDLKFESLTITDLKIRVHGNAAIVTYSSADKGTYKGQDFTGKSQWTDTFLKIKGKWMIVATHGTSIMPQQ